MSGETVCKYNQSGHCKYKQECRNKHENQLGPEESYCKSKECSMRHPKACRKYFREESCRFGENCSYKHKKDLNQDILKQMTMKVLPSKKTLENLKKL